MALTEEELREELRRLNQENTSLRIALGGRDRDLQRLNENMQIIWKEEGDICDMLMKTIEEAKKAEKEQASWENYALFLEGKLREMTEKKNTYKQMVKSFSAASKKIYLEDPVASSLVL